MGEMDLLEYKYNGRRRRWVLHTEHLIVYEYREACRLHHIRMFEVCDLSYLSIRTYLIPQSVEISNEPLIPLL
jgi:hypothetical protein